MEEKERYGITDGYYLGNSAIFNTETNDILGLYQICDLLNQQDKENQQLKQQLHDLPKKIVGEIRKEIEFPLYVHPDFDEFECLFDIDKLLDTILKKYGGEDESK